MDYEYRRCGMANLFMLLEPLMGSRHVEVTERRTDLDFAQQMRALVDDHYPDVEKIRVVLDNLSSHGGAALYESFCAEEARRILRKLEFRYTPKHGSWLKIRKSRSPSSGDSASIGTAATQWHCGRPLACGNLTGTSAVFKSSGGLRLLTREAKCTGFTHHDHCGGEQVARVEPRFAVQTHNHMEAP